MDLYILRHGIAVERGSAKYQRDSERPLTDEGIQKTKKIAKGMLRLEASFDFILSSPYVRALQTAEIVAKAYHMEKNLMITEHLASGGNHNRLISLIKKELDPDKNVLLVGHEPDLTDLISILISGGEDASLNLKKAGLVRLTTEDLAYSHCADLQYFLTPKQLILMAKCKSN